MMWHNPEIAVHGVFQSSRRQPSRRDHGQCRRHIYTLQLQFGHFFANLHGAGMVVDSLLLARLWNLPLAGLPCFVELLYLMSTNAVPRPYAAPFTNLELVSSPSASSDESDDGLDIFCPLLQPAAQAYFFLLDTIVRLMLAAAAILRLPPFGLPGGGIVFLPDFWRQFGRRLLNLPG